MTSKSLVPCGPKPQMCLPHVPKYMSDLLSLACATRLPLLPWSPATRELLRSRTTWSAPGLSP